MMLESLQGAMVVARQSLALGRSQGDERHYAAARAALAPWWQQERPPAELLLLRAILRQHDHQFNQALADLEQLLARAPDNAQAWLTRTVVLRELGEYDRALASCLPLLRLASTLVATTCTSNVASRLGRARKVPAVIPYLHPRMVPAAVGPQRCACEASWNAHRAASID